MTSDRQSLDDEIRRLELILAVPITAPRRREVEAQVAELKRRKADQNEVAPK